MSNTLGHYTVCTPQYTTYDYYQIDPPDIGSDCVTVIADNKRQAKVRAVRELRKMKSEWMDDQRSDNASPFTGLQVFENVCPHGICHCDICDRAPFWEPCKPCYDEAEKEFNESFSNG